MLNIICPGIMPIKSSKPKYRLVLSKSLKKRLWLKLPYPLRLQIERKCFVSRMIVVHLRSLDLTALQRLKLPLWRKLSQWYIEIIRLNNPYEPSINVPISKKDMERDRRLQDWLDNMRASGKIYPF